MTMQVLSALSRGISAFFGIGHLMAWAVPSGSIELTIFRVAGTSMLCAAVIPFHWRSSFVRTLFVIVTGIALFSSVTYLIYWDFGWRGGPDYEAAILRLLALATFVVIAVESAKGRGWDRFLEP